MSDNKKQKLRDRANFLDGVSSAFKEIGKGNLSGELQNAASNLREASNNMCSQGFYGCYDPVGKFCTSSHK